MAIRIRVHPNGGFGGTGGYGGYGFGNNLQAANIRLQNEKQKGNLRLNYERALFQERLQRAQLEAALQFGGGVVPNGMMGGLGTLNPGVGVPPGFGVVPGAGYGFGAGGLGGFGGAFGGFGAGILGALGLGGQNNITNQTASGSANQSATNSNAYRDVGNTYVMGGGGFAQQGLFGQGGWLGGLLGWL